MPPFDIYAKILVNISYLKIINMIDNKIQIFNILEKLDFPDNLKDYILKNIEKIDLNDLVEVLEKYITNIEKIKFRDKEIVTNFNKSLLKYNSQNEQQNELNEAELILENEIKNII